MNTGEDSREFQAEFIQDYFFREILTNSYHVTISKLVKFGFKRRAIVLKNQRESDYKIAEILTNIIPIIAPIFHLFICTASLIGIAIIVASALIYNFLKTLPRYP